MRELTHIIRLTSCANLVSSTFGFPRMYGGYGLELGFILTLRIFSKHTEHTYNFPVKIPSGARIGSLQTRKTVCSVPRADLRRIASIICEFVHDPDPGSHNAS